MTYIICFKQGSLDLRDLHIIEPGLTHNQLTSSCDVRFFHGIPRKRRGVMAYNDRYVRIKALLPHVARVNCL
jgi:hypothetical protein